MEILKSPLLYFDVLLESNKYDQMKNDYMDKYLEERGNLKFENSKFDYDKGIIIEDEQTDLSYCWMFKNLIDNNIRITKNKFDKILLEMAIKNIDSTQFLQLNIASLTSLIIKADNFYANQPFLSNTLMVLKKDLEIKLNPHQLYNNNKDSKISSFEWDYFKENEEATQLIIEKLYDGLLNLKLIEGAKEDFINGFMKKEVKYGIKWLDKTNTKKDTNKGSLIGFINLLIKGNFINDIKEKEYNDALVYVFRDFNGNKLKNIRQAKSSYTGKLSEEIQDLIYNLN
ncbi:hypothetical protein ACTS9U_13435 [Empedobacter falsenii]